MKTKTSRLIELVKDKTLLREAPLARDLIVELYNYDIDDPSNKRKRTEIKGERPAYNRRKTIRKFASLVRNLREKSGPVLYEVPKYNFRIVRDENNVRRVVHIKEGVNEDYILQKVRYGRSMRIDDWEEEEERWQIKMLGVYEERVDSAHSWADSNIRCKKEILMKNYCKNKHIKKAIEELRHSWVQTKLTDIFSSSPSSSSTEGFEVKSPDDKIMASSKYRPNFRGIQYVLNDMLWSCFSRRPMTKIRRGR